MDWHGLLDPLAAACREAGAAIEAVRRAGFAIERKGDQSPVTEADRAAEAILLAALAEHAPAIPVVAEEEVAAGRCPEVGELFFLVDPLDGTREFCGGGDDYTVNIGLVRGGGPVLGLVYAPARQRLWSGIVGIGAWASQGGGPRPVSVRTPPPSPVLVATKSHGNAATEAFLEKEFPDAPRLAVGSSLKFCLVAEGKADLYPRLSPTCEWDTAAGHAVLQAAGGWVVGEDGAPLAYGKADFRNGWFVASGGLGAPPLGPYRSLGSR